MLKLDGKVAVVTGAGLAGPGLGNGKATAVLMVGQEAAVFALDNRDEEVQETLGIIRDEGGRAIAHMADVTSSAEVSGAVGACVTAFGGLDILVNNVGGSFPGGAESLAEEDWERQIDFSLRSAFLCCKHALPHLKLPSAALLPTCPRSPRFA
jgi:NAD(P)-dependent dehydrogenase (short-subunit alcohol dehydrogenase family)